MRDRRWSYTDLQDESDRALTRGRWPQLGSGAPQRRFPDPASLLVIAHVLQLDITTVVFAAAQTLGLDVATLGSATCPVCGPCEIPSGRATLRSVSPGARQADLVDQTRASARRGPGRRRRSLRGLSPTVEG